MLDDCSSWWILINLNPRSCSLAGETISEIESNRIRKSKFRDKSEKIEGWIFAEFVDLIDKLHCTLKQSQWDDGSCCSRCWLQMMRVLYMSDMHNHWIVFFSCNKISSCNSIVNCAWLNTTHNLITIKICWLLLLMTDECSRRSFCKLPACGSLFYLLFYLIFPLRWWRLVWRCEPCRHIIISCSFNYLLSYQFLASMDNASIVGLDTVGLANYVFTFISWKD